ncbi:MULTISPECIES: YybS family protein [Bacillus cereus group]|uniref:YybS family protein n=1 Tax=Bacillus cereus group TaxID=86661 RepID=UPI0022E63D7E|nr:MULTISPECIES: YybS family protein [unclassified Bacillus cereus group]MDA2662476.1 YybS family protein [Bacillus cereus group sp. Bc032]MDA2673145.1 YybS family protein [Bacillus cereus group sp. Bc031]MDA2678573.1 YybS family protein [Bacillus cereus group sp. Bc029]MDA2684082.1 YybS family protein [Bacillus cereus group sp. Bc030]MDA2739612.1 YybS family protein [Bacillus cereus group sp. Bc011]
MKQVRFITEGAALLAIYVMLLFISMYVPILGTVVTFALPLPFILLTIRYKLSNVFVIFTAAFLIAVFVSQPIGLVKTVVFGLMGIVLGCMYKKQRKPLEILITGSLAYLISIMLIYVASIKFFNIDFIKQIQNMFNKSIVQSEKIASVAGMPISKEQKELFVQMNDILQAVFPSILVMVSVCLSWITIIISGSTLRKLKHDVIPWPKFKDIQLPKSIVWYYVIFILLSTFIKVEPTSYLHMVFSNLYVIFALLLVLQGLTFITFLAHSKGFTKGVPIISFIACMFIPMLFPLVTILGIIDLGISLRSKIGG